MYKNRQWEWFKDRQIQDNEVTCHSLIAGNVLCRYWGDIPKSKEARLIEKAAKLLGLLKELREWHRSEYQSNPNIDKRVDEIIKELDS